MASGAILIGGEARRFHGRDKSQLIVDGQTILDRQLAAFSSVTDDVMLIGGDSLAKAPAGCRTVPDAFPRLGPLAGLHTALRAARHDAVILLACDMPFITSDFLAFLAANVAGADALVPTTARGRHPLCAAYRRRCLPVVERRLLERELAMHALLGEIAVKTAGIETLARFGAPERLLANVNTPADLDDLERLPSHKQ